MREFILSLLAVVRVFCQSRSDTAIEVLALRQQVAVLKRKRPRRVLNAWDRLNGDEGPRMLFRELRFQMIVNTI